MTVSVALIGCGGWGKNIGRSLHELGVLAAICDPTRGAADLAIEWSVPYYADIDTVLNDPAVRAVAIATPAATHAQIALRALAAGKDVFVEKPIALNDEDAQAMMQMAAHERRVLMVGHLLQYHPVFVKLLDMVEAGDLGDIKQVISSRLNFGMIRKEENVLWSFAPHDISMALALIPDRPVTVQVNASTMLQDGIPDYTSAFLRFENGASASITSSWLSPIKEQKLVVIGTKAMAVFDDRKTWDEKLTIYENSVVWNKGIPKAVPGSITTVAVCQEQPLIEEMRAFVSAVETRLPPRTDSSEAIRVLNVLHAAQQSIDNTGQLIMMNEIKADFSAVHPTALVDDHVTIGAQTKIWHFSHILSRTHIGEGCVIGQNVMIGPDVVVGNGCKIQNNVAIYKGVTIEDDVFCGPSMVFTNVLTPRAHIERKDEFAPTLVGRGATLGANCTIVCGNRIGQYSMVGAGAVVTKDVPDYALVVGNPARQIGWVSEAGERLGGDLTCPRTGQRYHLKDSKLAKG